MDNNLPGMRRRKRVNACWVSHAKRMTAQHLRPAGEPTRCVYCGATGNLERDHVEPLSRGGAHVVDNLVWACRRCNRSKCDGFLLEWVMAGLAPFGPSRLAVKPALPLGTRKIRCRVIAIRGHDEVLSCGHVRPPSLHRRTPTGTDAGMKRWRMCRECAASSPPSTWTP